MFGVMDLTFFQKVDSLPRFTEGVDLLFFKPLCDCFSFFNNANFFSLDKTESNSEFFLFWLEFISRPTDRLASYNSTTIGSFNIKKVSSAIRWINNNDIDWSLFTCINKDIITFFKEFVDRFVLTDRRFVLSWIHYPPCPNQ